MKGNLGIRLFIVFVVVVAMIFAVAVLNADASTYVYDEWMGDPVEDGGGYCYNPFAYLYYYVMSLF